MRTLIPGVKWNRSFKSKRTTFGRGGEQKTNFIRITEFTLRTCGFIKPEAMDRKGEILESFTDSNLKIINVRMVQLTEQQATSILEEYDDHSIIG